MSPPAPSEFIQHLRRELVTGISSAPGTASPAAAPAPGAVDSREQLPFGPATFPLRGPQEPEVALDAAATGVSIRAARSEVSSG
jgi:hypothetical protein